MAFSDNYYYDIVLIWIEQYKKEADSHMKELLLRNIISRAYYTMLLHCREQHTSDPKLAFDIMQGSHEQIIDLIKKPSVQSTLFNYKLSRKRSDYYIEPMSLPIMTIRLGKTSKQVNLLNIDIIKIHMNEILSYQI